MRAFIPLSASVLAGLCAGLTVSKNSVPPARAEPVSQGPVPQETAVDGDSVPGASGGQASFLNRSEVQPFETLPLERQKEALARVLKKAENSVNTSEATAFLRGISKLSFEQASALWEGMPKEQQSRMSMFSPDLIGELFAEQLASVDPRRALEFGKSVQDKRIINSAVAAIGAVSGADALRAIGQLPKEQRGEALMFYFDDFKKVGGSLADVSAALKENPDLLDKASGYGYGLPGLMGKLAAKEFTEDPAKAVSMVRAFSANLLREKTGLDEKERLAEETRMSTGMANSMISEMRRESPAAASAAFDALGESEKSRWALAGETVSRFKAGGVEAGIQFAEKQTKDENLKSAAGAVWWSLAQQDRSAAIEWIDSLPAGAFRDGVLRGVMDDANMRSHSWGDVQVAVDAAKELGTSAARLDYFAAMVQTKRYEGRYGSQGEFLASLPLSESERQELVRRLAPLKSK